MANLEAIYSLGSSLVTYLKNVYPVLLSNEHSCEFRLFSSGELSTINEEEINTTVSLYLYRITMNEFVRNCVHPNRPSDSIPPLSIDLHYLITIWAGNAHAEHTIAAWVMRELHHHPIMDVSSLSTDGNWKQDEVVQLIPEELSTEDMMRIWDSINPGYRLSLSYIARVVKIDSDESGTARPVVAVRKSFNGDIDA